MSDLEHHIETLSIWKQGDQRAPHKPLLLLLALGHYQRGGDRMIAFTAVEEHLKNMLMEFGPFRQSYHPEYPFWRLQSDGIWELETVHAENAKDRQGREEKN